MLKFTLCFLFLFPFISYAQEAKEKTDNNFFTSPVIANYSLTEDFLLKLEKIGEECKNLSPEQEITDTQNDVISHDDTIEGYITSISRKSKLMRILKENNLTPKDFVVGLLTLQTTLIMLTNEEYPSEKQNIISSSNLEFGKKHMYRIIKVLKQHC